jgi:putative hydrolase of the HAD superfamily
MLLGASRIIFHPRTFIKTRKFFDDSIELVRECKERGFQVYFLSNWDRESGKFLVKRKPDLFALADGTIFSGDVQKTKPEEEMFRYITDIIPAEKCVFVDDQQENIDAARALGFNTILVESSDGQPNISAVREQLKNITPLPLEEDAIYA